MKGIGLYDYQQTALDSLRSGSILCGGVGSGKSRTSLAYFFSKVCDGELSPYKEPTKTKELYVITTARKRDTLEWEEEMVPFGLSTDNKLSASNIAVTIDSWNNIKKYVSVTDAFFIFDEQRVVGSGTWARSFVKISKANAWIMLSATPGDTWLDYVSVFVANGFYKNRSDFLRQHVIFNYYTRYPKVERYVNVNKLINLRNQILVNMDYVNKTEPHSETIRAEYDKALYLRVVKLRQNPFEEWTPIRDAGALVYILRRIVNTDFNRVAEAEKLVSSHKKSIIFYNFNYELDLLRDMALRLDIPCAEWNGQKHEPIPKEDSWVYLVQYTAGAEGWNCIETNVIIFYSLNYSYKVMKQAAGRIDRLNTPYHDLYYYYLSSKSSIDNAISGALSRKRTFNESSFGKKIGFFR